MQDPVLVADQPVTISIVPTRAPWLVFMHTADVHPIEYNQDGFISPTRGMGQLGEALCEYVLVYDDGSTERTEIKRRHQMGASHEQECCVGAVLHTKPKVFPGGMREKAPNWLWGVFQTYAAAEEPGMRWKNWIWAWENPHPDKAVVGLRFEPTKGAVLIFGISAGHVASNPLRWQPRQKALFTLPEGVLFDPKVGKAGHYRQIQLDMGQVISARQRLVYPKDNWEDTDNNDLPELSPRNILIEYTAHPEAYFHLSDGSSVSLDRLNKADINGTLTVIPPAEKTVRLRVLEKKTGKPVPVKLHVHGTCDEYLTPVDRQRMANPSWFQDYTVDYIHRRFKGHANPSMELHHSTYIAGETTIKMPQGKVYLEVSKGFEFRPVRKIVDIAPGTEAVVIALEKMLPWREKGWVTADTHVHFLSPPSARLEGAAEGVNIINLLASQWGELMTNVGDFDGQTTFGSKAGGGDGEYLVRVGTENRQRLLGHISLLGYTGDMITPLCSGGPGESALGDPVEVLLTEWAAQCKAQNGLVVIPHFPDPRMENAATIVSGNVDGIEMTSWGDLYSGISPYSLSDWYRYLNCGYLAAAVAGTDKMSADTAVGTIRTYAHIDPEMEFTYEAWKDAIRSARTFVTYGPLMEFSVDGKPPGSRIDMSAGGGTVDVSWRVASVTVPMSRVDLIVNGEIRESQTVDAESDEGNWSLQLDNSSWLALLVRGHYSGKPEIITAHSSPVMVQLEGSPFMAAADAITILEQIEGALTFIDTIGTRADVETYKRMRLVLTSAHRTLHNRMHQQGYTHHHPSVETYGPNH
ncbi:MAG: CehA/McbA family metallohydrolase [Deltaproteobacteria bacterium]|nr:CehA/McbA family metallohydrolase [Deltaproteobacteria bacterium]